jgi:integrase
MHVVPRKGRWTFRYREWVSTDEATYQKYLEDKTHKVKSDDGKYYYEKYQTIPLEKIPVYKTKEEAEKNMPIFEAKYDQRLAERQKRESWHDKYYQFEELIRLYESNRKITAKNSWDSKIFWFKDYVLEFFLNNKHAANLEEWKFYFKEFKSWLRDAKTKRSQKPLSFASKNHCINELNCFLSLMWDEGQCDPQPKLSLFSEKEVNNHKTAKDLISDSEFNAIYNQLKVFEELNGTDSHHSDAYYILRHTGMRINELRGIGLNDVRPGRPPRKEIDDLLKSNNFGEVYSYIFLQHQPANIERSSGIHIEWKPLKGKSDTMKDARYIPITDALTHNILRKYYLAAKVDKETKRFGEENRNYAFFFDYVSSQGMRYRIEKAYKAIGKEDDYKSTHYSRHTNTTDIVSKSKGMSDELAKLILGHSKGSKATERYNLLYKEIIEKEANKERFDEEFAEVPIKSKSA